MTNILPRTIGSGGALALCLTLSVCLAGTPSAVQPPGAVGDDPPPGLDTITEKDVAAHLSVLADPGMEGRDSPSEGQERCARYIAEVFRAAGCQPATDSVQVMKEHGQGGPEEDAEEGTFLRPFRREMTAPVPDDCSLMLLAKGDETTFEYGTDFVPLAGATGSVRGELLFAGFGISDSGEKYDDFKGQRTKGKIVLFFEGEPRHKKKFEGPEVTDAASVWTKLANLPEHNVAAALIVRRQPEGVLNPEENLLDYRYTRARFPSKRGRGRGRGAGAPEGLPVLEISMGCASELLGTDAEALARKMDRSARPTRHKTKGREVSLDSATRAQEVRHDNVLGILVGTDPELAEEYVILGAHYDHIGVGPGGRVGCGADDNASGVAAMLEIATALAAGAPRRSVIFCAFTAEEDGLFGSKDIAENLPVPREQVVAMVNLDQIGRGKQDEVVVLGLEQNPKLDRVLSKAKRLAKTGVKKIITGKGESLFARSDHYSFHEIGIPTLFFFEHVPITDNKDYHTWRDTIDGVDHDKIARTARLVLDTVWILANDDDRPPPPRG